MNQISNLEHGDYLTVANLSLQYVAVVRFPLHTIHFWMNFYSLFSAHSTILWYYDMKICKCANINLLVIGNPSLNVLSSFSSEVYLLSRDRFEIPVGTLMSSNTWDYKVSCQIQTLSMPEIIKSTAPFFHTIKHLSACCWLYGVTFPPRSFRIPSFYGTLKSWCQHMSIFFYALRPWNHLDFTRKNCMREGKCPNQLARTSNGLHPVCSQVQSSF